MRYRKTAMVRAVDMRQKRRAAGYTADRFAEVLDCADGKHVSAIEVGKCALTLEKAARAAVVLGPVLVDVEGVGRFVVMPEMERVEVVLDRAVNRCLDGLRPILRGQFSAVYTQAVGGSCGLEEVV